MADVKTPIMCESTLSGSELRLPNGILERPVSGLEPDGIRRLKFLLRCLPSGKLPETGR